MAKKPPPENVNKLIKKHTKAKHRVEDRTPLTDRGKTTESRLRIPRWLGGKG